jgi:hypothetical protein
MSGRAARPSYTVPFFHALLVTIISSLTFFSTACGSGTGKTATTTTTTPTAPSQPNYPTVPPEQISWPFQNPAQSNLPAPTAEDESTAPWKNGANDFPLTVSNPLNNSTVTSPVNVVATATPKNPMFFMRVYVDQLAVYFTFNNSINTQIFLAPGAHTLTVMAEDQQGYISATPLQITVSAQAPNANGQTTISGIQAMPGWQSCGGLFPPGSGRAGQICAAGFGTPQSTITQNVSSPSMDGNSAQFMIGPSSPDCPGYCNMLYFNPVAGGNSVTHFVYDLYFMIDKSNVQQALEFDLNQTFGGNRWVWGSECNFNGSGKWDIWNDAPNTGWIPTNIACTPFPANTWIHLVWNVERVGNQVHYISLTVGDQTYQVDTYYPNQSDWTLEEIDTAFQMDLDSKGDVYNVWLDKVNLTAY